jgi:two-component system sensor histidine kinase BarA
LIEKIKVIDAQIVNIYRTDLHNKNFINTNPINNDIPVLAIVSTQSRKDTNNIRHFGFNDAVFRSTKNPGIKNTLTNLINKNNTSGSLVPIYVNPPSRQEWTGINVLVVDDNEINLKFAEILLKENGANVVTATSGEKSIECVNNQVFDLIFMDLQMPGLDGYEATKNIRCLDNGKQSVILALTANAMAKDKTRVEKYGMNDLIIKPISKSIVQEILNRWLNKKSERESKIVIKKVTHSLEIFSKIEAIELAAGNEQLANELTLMLIDELPDYRTEIKNAFLNKCKVKLKDNTHKLHGASRCCGTPALRFAASQLEQAIDNDITDQLESDISLLIHEIDRLLNSDPKDLRIVATENAELSF